jgi:hypothetical protein
VSSEYIPSTGRRDKKCGRRPLEDVELAKLRRLMDAACAYFWVNPNTPWRHGREYAVDFGNQKISYEQTELQL